MRLRLHFFIPMLGTIGTCLSSLSAQSDPHLRHLNPASVAERTVFNLDIETELHNLGFERSEKDAYLDFSIPMIYGKPADGRYMFFGLTASNHNFNIENRFVAMARYGIRFNFSSRSRNLYLTTALGAGLEYDHIDIERLLENGSDPFVNELAPNRYAFAGQVGLALHNEHFSVSVFSPRLAQRLSETEVAISAGWQTDPDRKAAFSLSGYGSYTAEGVTAGFYGRIYASGVFGRFLGLDLDYDSRNRLHAGASIHIKESLFIGYKCGFQAFRVQAAGMNFLSHEIKLSLTLLTLRQRANRYD